MTNNPPTSNLMDASQNASPRYMTSGERLLEFLRTNTLGELHSQDLLSQVKEASRPISREEEFASALQDLVSINALRRLLLSAGWAFTHYRSETESVEERDVLVVRYLKRVITNEFHVSSSQVDQICNRVLDASQASRQRLGRPLRQETFDQHGMICYACGIILTPRGQERNQATIEHLWPKSLGGDTNFDNLLPACKGCNDHRNDHPVWSSFWFQDIFLGPYPSERAMATKLGLRTIVALQFFRAYTMTRQSEMSLKEALMELGPVEIPDVIDREYPSDFFSVLGVN